jgi:hypothetical protein
MPEAEELVLVPTEKERAKDEKAILRLMKSELLDGASALSVGAAHYKKYGKEAASEFTHVIGDRFPDLTQEMGEAGMKMVLNMMRRGM